MAEQKQTRAKRHNVLISLKEATQESVESIAEQLRSLGLKNSEIIGRVIAGEATTANLAKMGKLTEVEAIEKEPMLRVP